MTGSAVRADHDGTLAQVLPPDPVRTTLDGIGVTYGAEWIGEYFDVAKGGLSRGSAVDGRLALFADLDLQKFAGWRGGAFHVTGYHIQGQGPQAQHLGSIAPASSIEALDSVRLFELWFEQGLLDDKLKIKAGQIAADEEFILADTASQFLNGTFGWPGSVAANMLQGGPAYPFAAPGVRVSFQPTDQATFLVALFNSLPASPSAADPQRDNRHGTNFRIGDPPLLMVEGQFRTGAGLESVLKLGGWKAFNDFPDQLTGTVIDSDHGLYAIVDQQIWRNGPDQDVHVFARFSSSPDAQNLIDFYFDAGLVLNGLVAGRPKDSIGAAFAYAKISDRARAADIRDHPAIVRDYEAVLEINYTADVAPGWSLTPDFQYFWNPGGRVEDPTRPGRTVGDAAVFGLRTVLTY